jgi:hypothetical protein
MFWRLATSPLLSTLMMDTDWASYNVFNWILRSLITKEHLNAIIYHESFKPHTNYSLTCGMVCTSKITQHLCSLTLTFKVEFLTLFPLYLGYLGLSQTTAHSFSRGNPVCKIDFYLLFLLRHYPKGSQHVRLTTSPPSVSRMSRKCEGLDVSQPRGPPRPVTGTALLYLTSRHYPSISV